MGGLLVVVRVCWGRKKKEVYFVDFSFLFEGKGVGNWNSKERKKRGIGLFGS